MEIIEEKNPRKKACYFMFCQNFVKSLDIYCKSHERKSSLRKNFPASSKKYRPRSTCAVSNEVFMRLTCAT